MTEEISKHNNTQGVSWLLLTVNKVYSEESHRSKKDMKKNVLFDWRKGVNFKVANKAGTEKAPVVI